MKIKLDGVSVCSICGSAWETDEPQGKLCGSCGADSQMEDLPFDEGMICEDDEDGVNP